MDGRADASLSRWWRSVLDELEAMRHEVDTALAAGMDDVVSKPFQATELIEVLSRLTGRLDTGDPPAIPSAPLVSP